MNTFSLIPERCKHKKVPIKIVVVLSEDINRAGQSELANVFNNHLNEIRQTVGKGIYLRH